MSPVTPLRAPARMTFRAPARMPCARAGKARAVVLFVACFALYFLALWALERGQRVAPSSAAKEPPAWMAHVKPEAAGSQAAPSLATETEGAGSKAAPRVSTEAEESGLAASAQSPPASSGSVELAAGSAGDVGPDPGELGSSSGGDDGPPAPPGGGFQELAMADLGPNRRTVLLVASADNRGESEPCG